MNQRNQTTHTAASPLINQLRQLEEAVGRRVQAEQVYAEQFGAGIDPQQEELERDLARVIEAERQQHEALREQFAEQRSEVNSAWRTETDALKSERDAAVARVEREARQETDRVNRQHEDSRWVASSVLDESAEESPKRQYERARAALEKTREQQRSDYESLRDELEQISQSRGWSLDPLPPPETDARDLDAYSAEFTHAITAAREQLQRFQNRRLPQLFVGWRPLAVFVGMAVAIGLLVSMVVPPSIVGAAGSSDPIWFAAVAGTAVVVSILLLTVLYTISSMQLSDAFSRMHEQVSAAQFFHQRWSELAAKEQQRREREYQQQREQRERQLQEQLQRYEAAHQQSLAEIEQRRQTAVNELLAAYTDRITDIDAAHDERLAVIDRQEEQQLVALQGTYEAERVRAQTALDEYLSQRQNQQQHAWDELSRTWFDGVKSFDDYSADARRESEQRNLDWSELAKPTWDPPGEIPEAIRIGEVLVDLGQLEEGLSSLELLRPSQTLFRVPFALPFPESPSLLFETRGQEGRRDAVQAMQVALLRMLTRIPPGKLRLTIIDPVGLGESFSGLMHLADYDELLITSRIWTEMNHIEARLAELTEHMENVLQKYLRNEFATIEEYNHFAGEVAEPYHVLVVADFPNKFSEQAARRLVSIATSGPRCGVYLLMSCDRTAQMPNAFDLAAIEATSNTFSWRSGAYHATTKELSRWPLTIDTPPSPETFTQIVKNVGEASKDVRRVEVAFTRIAPSPEEVWTKDSRHGIDIPLGRAGATKLQHLRLGKGTSQHMLVAGKTGSGKSTFFHTLITNVGMYYSPEEVELYLVDFKKGVEFKAYAPQNGRPGSEASSQESHETPTDPSSDRNGQRTLLDGLPHARVIAIESDREFGVSVLQRLDAILNERGELFRRAGVQDIAGYRDRMEIGESGVNSAETGNPQQSLPRILLIIDEFQEFFVEDDRYSQQAALLLDRLVRQGRAFGVHVILGSQTLGGAYSLARSTLGQVAVRVALQCSEADAHLILSEENTAARLLTRPGEAIYNDANGMVEGNHPFQIAWLPDEERAGYLGVMNHFRQLRGLTIAPPVVFEGNVPSDPARNEELTALLSTDADETQRPTFDAQRTAPRIWLGESVDIGPPTSVTFPPHAGNNLLIVGSDTGGATGILTAALIALAANSSIATRRRSSALPQFFVFDGSAPGSPESDVWQQVAAAVPSGVELFTPQNSADAIRQLTVERHRREGALGESHPPLFVFVAGISKFRDLRKSEDDFSLSSFGSASEDSAPDLGRQFADLLSNGPELHMHTLLWADSYSNVDRWLSRQSLREFELRIAFPMNAADSSNLIDSPAASRLGVHRALLYREETGIAVKFRPYGPPTGGWLTRVRNSLAAERPLEVATTLEGFRVT